MSFKKNGYKSLIALFVLIILTLITIVIFKRFNIINHNNDSASTDIGISTGIQKSNKIAESESFIQADNPESEVTEIITEPNEETSLNGENKAIIILPGITGSELISAKDHKINSSLTVEKGDLIWPPFEFTEIDSELDLIGSATDYVKYAAISLEMLRLDENGKTIYDIIPKEVTENDLFIGTLSTATLTFNELYNEFSDTHEIIFFSYDWRQSCADIAASLEEYIDSCGFDDVTFVCHSMGGLVAAHYLNLNENNISKTNQVITVGTPFGGSPKALMALQLGRFLDYGIVDPIIKSLSYNMQSIYELLPNNTEYIYDNGKLLDSVSTYSWLTEDIIIDSLSQKGVNNKVYTNALNTQALLDQNGSHIMNNKAIDVCMIAGYNIPTVINLHEKNDYISSVEESYEGDGTVSIDSSVKYNSEYFDNPIYFIDSAEHRTMLNNKDVVDTIINAIKYGSDIPEEYIDHDIVKTKETLKIKNEGIYSTKEINESYVGGAFGIFYDLLLNYIKE